MITVLLALSSCLGKDRMSPDGCSQSLSLCSQWKLATSRQVANGLCRDDFIGHAVRLEFCSKLVSYLMTTRRMHLHDLVRFKCQLAKAVQQKIAAHRQA